MDRNRDEEGCTGHEDVSAADEDFESSEDEAEDTPVRLSIQTVADGELGARVHIDAEKNWRVARIKSVLELRGCGYADRIKVVQSGNVLEDTTLVAELRNFQNLIAVMPAMPPSAYAIESAAPTVPALPLSGEAVMAIPIDNPAVPVAGPLPDHHDDDEYVVVAIPSEVAMHDAAVGVRRVGYTADDAMYPAACPPQEQASLSNASGFGFLAFADHMPSQQQRMVLVCTVAMPMLLCLYFVGYAVSSIVQAAREDDTDTELNQSKIMRVIVAVLCLALSAMMIFRVAKRWQLIRRLLGHDRPTTDHRTQPPPTLEQVVSQHPASLERSQSAVQLGGSVERATGRVTRREAEDGAEAIELQRRASVTRLEHGFTNEFEALDRGRRPRGEAAVLMAQRSAVAVPDYRFTNEFEALDDAYQERAASV